ncbi:MAG: hypothetical protein L0Y54_02080 [Sporichthyaceae bacterium]|nr:hypothetical protein [Sporichthyaceae bacterium]
MATLGSGYDGSPGDLPSGGPQRTCRLGQRGAGGQNIIYQHDLPPGDQRREPGRHDQRTAEVDPSVGVGQTGLINHSA